MSLAEMIVKIGADTSDFSKKLTGIDKQVHDFGGGLQKIGGGLTTYLTAPIAAVGAGLAASAIQVGSFADSLLDLVDQTGLSSGTLQEFRHVALTAGVEADTLANAAIKLTSGLQGSGEQSKQMAGALGELGLSATTSTGQLVSMDALLPEIISRLQGMDDVTTRNTLAADIFGRSWAELAPVLSLGAGEMDAARQQAHDLGLVLSGEALESADAFRRQVDTLKASTGAITREIGVAVLPIMTDLAKTLQTKVVPSVQKVVGWFDDLSPTTKKTVGVVAALTAGLGPLIVATGTIIKLLPTLAKGFTTLGGATGIGAVIVGVAALTYAWNEWGYGIQKIVGAVMGFIREHLVTRFKDYVGNVLDILDTIVGGFRWLADKVGIHVPDMVGGIRDSFAKLDSWMSWPAEEAATSVATSFEGMKYSAVMAASETSTSMQEMADAIQVMGPPTVAAVKEMGTAMSRYLTPEAKEAYLAAQQVKKDFEAMGGSLEKVPVPAKKAGDALATGQGGGLGGAVQSVIDKLTAGEGGGLMGAVGKLADELGGSGFASKVNAAIDLFKNDGDTGLFGAAAKVIGKFTGNGGLTDSILSVATELGGGSKIWGAITRFVSELVKEGGLMKVLETVAGWIGRVAEGIRGLGAGPNGLSGGPWGDFGGGGGTGVGSGSFKKLASGGIHSGGMRLVGESGPELEVTGPSRIYSNQQTRDMLGSEEIIRLLQDIHRELRRRPLTPGLAT